MNKLVFFHHNTVSVGAGLSALHILMNIPQKEYEVVVCLPKGEGDLEEKISAYGMRVRRDFPKAYSYMHVSGYHYRIWSVSHIHNVFDIIKDVKIVKQIVDEERPDIVIVNSVTLFWIGRVIKRCNPSIRLICFDRETYCRGNLGLRTHFMKKHLNRYFDKIVFLSEYDKKETGKEEEKYAIITDKVDVSVYNGLDKVACRKELMLPEEEKIILFVGGISRLKGIVTALKMIRYMKEDSKLIILQCQRPDVFYHGIRKIRRQIRWILGKDVDRWCENYIAKQNLKDKLILRGRTDEVEKYFVACDLVIFPSTEPHQARPIFEAGISRRPIIVSDFENTREFLTENNGWLAHSIDYLEWAGVADEILYGGNEVDIRINENFRRIYINNNIDNLEAELADLFTSM